MNKKRLFIALLIFLLTLLMLVACKKPPNDNPFDGSFTVTREIADKILKDFQLGDNVFVTVNFNAFGYSIDGDNFVAYEKYGGSEYYYGKKGDQWYKATIDSEGNKSHIKLAQWEAIQYLNDIKTEAEYYKTRITHDYYLQDVDKNKEYGSEFGNLTVEGNGTWEKAGDKIPLNAFFRYSYNEVSAGVALLNETEFNFQNKKLTAVTLRYSEVVEGYIKDDERNPYTNSWANTLEYSYTTVLKMPLDMGEDVTTFDTLSVLRFENSSLPDLTNLVRGSKITLPQPENEAFLGWYYDRYYQFPIEGLYEIGYEDNTDARVFAKWQASGNISVELNGGTLSAQAQSKLSECILLHDVTSVEPVKKGYKFGGWYLDSALTTMVSYYDGELITEDIVVYAKWKPLVKITLSADISYNLPKLVGTEGDYLSLSYYTPVKRGAIFAGWYIDSNLTIPFVQTPYTAFPASDTTYYAKFEQAICVDINFENAALTIDLPKYINIPLTESEEYTFEDFLEEVTRDYYGGSSADGQGFHGWYLDSALTQPLTTYPTGNITLYPKIAPLYYYIIDAGEGTLSDAYTDTTIDIIYYRWNFSLEEGLAQIAEFYVTAPEGKVFDGWYIDAALTQRYNPTEYPTQTTTIYAAFIEQDE